MENKKITPNYIFEISWEVCNKIGGIYTVLSTAAKSLQNINKDKVIFIGPDFGVENPTFKESKTLLKAWKKHAIEIDEIPVRVGRWEVPGKPIAILVDHKVFFDQKDKFFGDMWTNFGVDSLNAYGDYDESAMFGYATAKVIESFYNFNKLEKDKVVAHFHEWTTASGLLYLKMYMPNISTVFTTHATTTGRSICFNNKPLYEFFNNYDGDQMSHELNIVAKHSIEKKAAHFADCFTTVSKTTAKECEQLLNKKPDIVTTNGFEADFVPKGKKYTEAREEARAILKKTTEVLTGQKISDNALFIGTSGRYEFKNKGLDVFIESLKILEHNPDVKEDIVAFIMVPGNISGARADLKEKLNNPKAKFQLVNNNTTHDLYDYFNDNVIETLRFYHMENQKGNKVKVIFIPSYLDGNDGIFNKSYYDLLIGLDITVFASYYEPWGYTPQESAAFGIPTITTDLSGFGLWVSDKPTNIDNGVAVIHRSDNNTHEVASEIEKNIADYALKTEKEKKSISKKVLDIAKETSWNNFISLYSDAFEIALKK